VLPFHRSSLIPRVEAGKNTSTKIPVSRKRRRNGNPVVSDETVMYGYEFSAALTTDRLHYKLHSRPLVREGAPRRRAKQLSGKSKEKEKSGHGPKGMPDTNKDRPTDRRSQHQLNSSLLVCGPVYAPVYPIVIGRSYYWVVWIQSNCKSLKHLKWIICRSQWWTSAMST
jgi:hypothetical protein